MANEGIKLFEFSVKKPVVYGAAGLLGIYLLSKYLQTHKENRILSAMQQQTSNTSELLKRIASKENNDPKPVNYPEF